MFIPAFLLQDECSFPQSELTEVGPSASSLIPFSEMDVDERPEDKREADKITAFITDDCKCPLNCSSLFSRRHYETIRSQCAELSHDMLDMLIMGQLMALTPRIPSSDINITSYMHMGQKVNA